MAKRAKGHVFEDRFLKLNGIQLAIAYRQALKEEEQEDKTLVAMNNAWAERFKNFFDILYMFANPKMYASVEQMKELEVLRQDVKPEEFPHVWEELMKVLPKEIVVEEPQASSYDILPKIDPELDEIFTGFVTFKSKKEGD